MSSVTLLIEDDSHTVAGFAELVSYSFGMDDFKIDPWIEITNISKVGQPWQLAGTKIQIDIPDEKISFIGCMAENSDSRTRFMAIDVVDFTGKSMLI